MDFRSVLLIFTLLGLGHSSAVAEDLNSYFRLNSKSNFDFGSDAGASYREVHTNKVIFQKVGYMANTVSDVSIYMDVPVYVALNHFANQTEYLRGSLNATLVKRTKYRGTHYTPDLEKYAQAALSKEMDLSVIFKYFALLF